MNTMQQMNELINQGYEFCFRKWLVKDDILVIISLDGDDEAQDYGVLPDVLERIMSPFFDQEPKA